MPIFDDNSAQGFSVLAFGTPDRAFIRKCGLEFVLENPEDLPPPAPSP